MRVERGGGGGDEEMRRVSLALILDERQLQYYLEQACHTARLHSRALARPCRSGLHGLRHRAMSRLCLGSARESWHK